MIPCEVTLENYRSVLFEELKEMDDFPFGLQCERHVHTRNGDPVAVKLAYDIYSLMAVLEGGEYSEIKEMFRSNKSTRCNVTINPCESSAETRKLSFRI